MTPVQTIRSSAAALMALALLLPRPAAAQPAGGGGEVKTITVEGSAAGTDANAREQARQDALRKAVEQACGTFISSQTKVKNFEALYDKAMSLAAGYVESYDNVTYRNEGDLTLCKLTARVSTASFEKEWARLLHTIEEEDNPRCVVVVIEDNNVDDTAGPRPDGVSQSVLENFFIEKGVQLMDKTATEDVRRRDIELAAINDDINKLAAMAAAFKADVVIRGLGEARQAGSVQMGGQTLFRWSGTLTIRAYQTDSAQMLMSSTYQATKTTTSQNAGGDEVLRACAEQNAGKILRDIGEAWRKRQNVRRTIQVTLQDCDRAGFKAFQAEMQKQQGVQSVRLKEMVNNVCQIEIDWAYDLERLASRIEELKADGATYVITEQTHDRITAKLVK